MDIRRIEPELVSPATASEQGGRVDNTRRRGGRQQRGRRERPDDLAEAPRDAPEPETPQHLRTYHPDGHLHDDLPADDHHAIDYKA